MTKTLATCFAVVLFTTPSWASAASLTDDQVNAILTLLQAFGADGTTIANVAVSLRGSSPVTCVNLSRTLTIGSTGSDVTDLQNYLIAQGYLAAGYNTGYYGYLTATAVGKVQVARGIVSAATDARYGITGSETRAAIGCAAPAPYANFSALPSSGTAPLHVEFRLSNYLAGALAIDFGDGTIRQTDDSCLVGGACNAYVRSHDYASAGTYLAKLYANGVEVRRTTISVGSGIACTAASVTQVYVNQEFPLRWTSTGIAGAAPYYQTGPTLYAASPETTTGIFLRGESDTQLFSSTKAGTMTFTLGTGGVFNDRPFVEYCRTTVPIIDSGTAYGTSIDRGSLFPRLNSPHTLSGATGLGDGTQLTIVLVKSTYAGSRDWAAVSDLIGTGSAFAVRTTAAYGGRWSVGFESEGQEVKYTVLVFSPNTTNALLTSGLLYATDKG
jgi:PKD repeat protein